MKTKNRVELIGHLGGSPVQKFTGRGTPYTYFSLATSRHWRNDAGDLQQQTEWHNIVAYGALADILYKFAHKGSAVALEGSLRTRPIPNIDGQKPRYVTEIVVADVNLLDKRPESNAPAAPSADVPVQNDETVPEPDLETEGVPF